MRYIVLICKAGYGRSEPEWYYISERIPMIPYTKSAWLSTHYMQEQAETIADIWRNTAGILNVIVREDTFSN